ncbi:MAG: hypothetical protein ACOYXT_07250 [Bacteroidota bacterium]
MTQIRIGFSHHQRLYFSSVTIKAHPRLPPEQKKRMNHLQKSGGVASIAMALIYLSMFVFYGAIFAYPDGADTAQKIEYLKQHQLSISIMNVVGFMLFGIFLAILVQSLHIRLGGSLSNLVGTATIFGFVWVGIIIAAGMIANLGLQSIINLSSSEPEHVRSVWLANDVVVSGLGGGIEIVGGLWVLLLSIAALRNGELSKGLNLLGLFVGMAGILTVYHTSTLLKEVFGVSQIIWFIWMGVVMLRRR